MSTVYLEFESRIKELDEEIAKLENRQEKPNAPNQLVALRNSRDNVLRETYDSLTPWQTVVVSRHQQRPQSTDYIQLMTDEFVELHGDRCFADDPAILTGFGNIDEFKVMLIAHRKGRTPEERNLCKSGSAHPEGYRKALLRMKLAEKFRLPIVCLIDSAGAYPGIESEQRGQHKAIADNLAAMSTLRTPMICVVIGEGGSGGALGMGIGNRIAMFQHAYYSVISPEGCAGILWKDKRYKEEAASALKLTSSDMLELGVIDEIIPEPVGGAHRDPHLSALRLKLYLKRQLSEVIHLEVDELLKQRYERFRNLGEYHIAIEQEVGCVAL